MRGRTLYVLMSIGDSVLRRLQVPTRNLANQRVSSPFSAPFMAIHFSAHVEKTTAGFTLSPADEQTLAAGPSVHLSNGSGDAVDIELVANFPDYISDPCRASRRSCVARTRSALMVVADQLYVTDGGRNLVCRRGRYLDGQFLPARHLPGNPRPSSPAVGGPVVDAVPTGIDYADGELLVTLFRGVPFAPGTSAVVQIDPSTGVNHRSERTESGNRSRRDQDGAARGDTWSSRTPPGRRRSSAGRGCYCNSTHREARPRCSPTTWRDRRRCCATRTGHSLYITELLTGRIVALDLGS